MPLFPLTVAPYMDHKTEMRASHLILLPLWIEHMVAVSYTPNLLAETLIPSYVYQLGTSFVAVTSTTAAE